MLSDYVGEDQLSDTTSSNHVPQRTHSSSPAGRVREFGLLDRQTTGKSMNKYFNLSEAAYRYDRYRPKVHDVIQGWLEKHLGQLDFSNAIDVACGTGDSLVPLSNIAHYSIGIDSSDEMLFYAKEKGLNVMKSGYDFIPIDGKCDLITTCMAFHWFDTGKAISEFKRISTDNAVWLIYNFTFNGSATSKDFNNIFLKNYLSKFPSPKRNKYSAVVPEDTVGIKTIGSGKGVIPIKFSEEQLIGYLTTQSNIEHAVVNGRSYEEIELELKRDLSSINFDDDFAYGYTYDIYQYHSVH